MVSLASIFGRRENRSGGDEIVPLKPEDLAWIPIDWDKSLGWEELRRRIIRYPHLAWRRQDGAGYVVGSYWRQRREIGVVEELGGWKGHEQLLERLIESFRSEGARLAAVDYYGQRGSLRPFTRYGFQPIDEIVHYEKMDCHTPDGPPKVTVRPCQPSDLPAVLRVEQASFPWLWWNSLEELGEYIKFEGVHSFVAVEGDEIIGFVSFTLRNRWAHLDRIAVQSAAQGLGLGRALLAFALAEMGENRVSRVTLNTQIENHKAIRLYKSFGFYRVPPRYTIYGLWLNQPNK